ncbi:MAG: WD40 repeat domain-containing protein [Methylobacter sp.]|nr:WD40 repeat domain-containing protein [Methylobacter sp.]
MKYLVFPLIFAAAVASPITQASLALTSAGVDAGFTLSTFVSGYNFGGGYGPLAQGIASDGKIITGSSGDGKIYVFNDVDNQTLSSAVSTTSYACQTGNCNWAMATAGSKVYGAQLFGGTYSTFASDGSFSALANLSTAGLRGYLGMWGNPVNGHLIASANVGLVDIDPVAGSYKTIVANLFPDGVSLLPDGTTAYVENGGTIQSYDLATGALLHTYFTGHAPDGAGVISGGPLDGKVVVNNNDGTVGLLDPTKANGDPQQFIIIANGGTRGDFVSADTTNGTLFLSQNERVERLSCGPNCSIGGTPAPMPLPQTFPLMIAGLFMVGVFSRSRINQVAL